LRIKSIEELWQMLELVHWQDPKMSALAFAVSMLVLMSLAAFSVISTISYLLLIKEW
uniref:Reticulon domain-containing protein n=1 Tax=Cyprinus carpio TaxID=7962 RepID=A0A8C2I6M2_CYPCA